MLGDSTKAKKNLGWEPETSFKDLVKLMVENDVQLAKREAVLMSEGLLDPTWEHSKT